MRARRQSRPWFPPARSKNNFEREKNLNFKGLSECVEMPWLNREANQAEHQRRRSRSQPGWKAQLGSEAPKLRAWQHGSSPSHPIEVVPTAARSHELIRCICISLEGLAKHQSARSDAVRCNAMRREEQASAATHSTRRPSRWTLGLGADDSAGVPVLPDLRSRKRATRRAV